MASERSPRAGRRPVRRIGWVSLLALTVAVGGGCPTYDLWLGDPLGGTADTADVATDVTPSSPCLQASTLVVDFGLVRVSAVEKHSLQNNCDAPVTVSGFVLSGAAGFSVAVDGKSWPVSPQTATEGVTLPASVALAAGEVLDVSVSFEAFDAEPSAGTLIWRSDDPVHGLGLAVKLRANTAVPCLVTKPKQVDFAGTLVAHKAPRQLVVSSCGDAWLQIHSLRIETGTAVGAFKVVAVDDAAWALAPGEQAELSLEYEAGGVAPIGVDGLPTADTAQLVLEANTFDAVHRVDLRGWGAAYPCPGAVIAPGPAVTVAPGDVLTLDGSTSYGVRSKIAAWEWAGEGPGGVPLQFLPSPADPEVTVALETSGLHELRLMVTDEDGLSACAAATHAVEVVPVPALYVDVTWETPLDEDPFDVGLDAGTDLDLHFVHPGAAGVDVDGDGVPDGWFDDPFDVSWHNPAPNWGDIDDPKADDDPTLDRDDRDGLGPERLLLPSPDMTLTYRIGVHHWDDSEFGAATPTVRVWLAGKQVAEVTGPELFEGELWDVGEISPGDGVFTPTDPMQPVMVPMAQLKSDF